MTEEQRNKLRVPSRDEFHKTFYGEIETGDFVAICRDGICYYTRPERILYQGGDLIELEV